MGFLTQVQRDPVFLLYTFTCAVLSLNLLLLWVASGAVRVRGRIGINPEDGAPLSERDPPAVARILRAHRNAEAVVYPFLLLGLLYVLEGGLVEFGAPVFGVFVIARLAHSGFYLARKQPWRTISFATSLLATLALLFADVWLSIGEWRFSR